MDGWTEGWREDEKERMRNGRMPGYNTAFAQDYFVPLSPVEPNQFPGILNTPFVLIMH